MKTAIRNTFAAVLSVLLLPMVVQAQDCASAPTVTVREINLIPQANIDILMAGGTDLNQQTIFDNLTNALEGTTVKFTAVVLTDWRNSGLASVTDGTPNRIHVFVRDTSAASLGVEGMGIQIVDDTGAIGPPPGGDFIPGDVIDVCGIVDPFISTDGKVMQIAPFDQDAITLAPVPPVPPEDPLRQPVLITVDDVHQELTDGSTQILWTTVSDFRGQFVRLEEVNVVDSLPDDTGRPDMLMQSVGENTLINTYDTSLRFRNDRCDDGPTCYNNPPFNTRPAGDPFVPPAPGGIVTIQGFLGYVGWDGSFGYSTPASCNYGISPIVDEDLEVISGPPIVATPSRPDFVPGNEPVTITAIVVPGDPLRTITGVDLDYEGESAGALGFQGTLAMTNTAGDTWEATIPAAPDNFFVFYSVTATDSEGEMSTSSEVYYLVLYNGITDIEHIQRTPDGQPGDSPFEGVTTSTDINLDAVVQADFESFIGRVLILQDDPAMGEWSGIWVDGDGLPAVTVGDRITITAATIAENFGLTQLEGIVFSNDGAGAPYAHKVMGTGLLNGDDAGFQEAHEGMLLRYDDEQVSDVNPDGTQQNGCGDPLAGFGEFEVSSDGTEANEVRVDDLASEIPCEFNIDNLNLGATIEFIQGPLYYSFGNFKLAPTGLADIGNITVSNEPVGPAVPGTYRLHAAYPNPFNPSATIRYEIGAAGPVTLKVYDVLGREVAVLVDGTLAPSTYEATFDASGLASGTYVYRLVAGGEVLTGRVTLVK